MWPGRFHARAGPARMATANATTISRPDISTSFGNAGRPLAIEPVRRKEHREPLSQLLRVPVSNVCMADLFLFEKRGQYCASDRVTGPVRRSLTGPGTNGFLSGLCALCASVLHFFRLLLTALARVCQCLLDLVMGV